MSEQSSQPPEHTHVFEWDEVCDYDDQRTIGARCSFMYEIPPGPRGKKPRKRRCEEYISMTEALAVINESVDDIRQLRREQKVQALRMQLSEIQNELDILGVRGIE